jgi:hypothetical protein
MANLSRLEVARDQLRAEIGGLDQYLSNERARLHQAMVDMVRRFESEAPALTPPPAPEDIDLSGLQEWADAEALHS